MLCMVDSISGDKCLRPMDPKTTAAMVVAITPESGTKKWEIPSARRKVT